MPIIKCEFCGKEFKRDAFEIAKRKTHYCSRKCYGLARRQREFIKCDCCGKIFERIKFFVNNNKKNYCSYECRFKGQQLNNNIKIKSNYAEMIINSPKYGNLIFLIDIDDIEKIEKYKWSAKYNKNVGFYGQTQERNNRKNRKSIKLHRYIMNCPDNLVVDHINHNTLDNRKCNLRNVTQLENSRNRK